HGHKKRRFVRFRRFTEAADFPHELQRSVPDLVGRDRRIEIEQWFDIPAHSLMPFYAAVLKRLDSGHRPPVSLAVSQCTGRFRRLEAAGSIRKRGSRSRRAISVKE